MRVFCSLAICLAVMMNEAYADAGNGDVGQTTDDMASGLSDAIGNGLDAAMDAAGDAAGDAADGLGVGQDDEGDSDD